MRTQLVLLCSLAIAAGALGCAAAKAPEIAIQPTPAPRPGPPAHAPAHGYRRKHMSGVTLRFDAEIGVYIVLGYTNRYFHDGSFLRVSERAWEASATVAGPWRTYTEAWVPSGLRSKALAEHPGRGKGKRESVPAKGKW